jgi:hypothetical protein
MKRRELFDEDLVKKVNVGHDVQRPRALVPSIDGTVLACPFLQLFRVTPGGPESFQVAEEEPMRRSWNIPLFEIVVTPVYFPHISNQEGK